MPTSYTVPGVYVEEVSTGARPISAVGSSTAAFLGYVSGLAPSTGAIAVNNPTEFRTKIVQQSDYRTGDDGTVAALPTPPLFAAVYGFFANGGSRCYVVALDDKSSLTGGAAGRAGLDLLETVDDVAIVAAPGLTDAASYDALLGHCEKMKDRVAVLDAPLDVPDVTKLTVAATATRPLKPAADPAAPGAPPAPTSGLRPRTSAGGYGACYYPWILTRDVVTGQIVPTPPSGHVSGLFARVDANRGVYKSPANETLVGAVGLANPVAPQDQSLLNPAGINCIRSFDEGVLVYGARTLAPEASEWRYLSVRRLFCVIEKSIERGTRWVVFEPNDEILYKAIRRDVGAFLTLLWRQGALRGASADQAFFVKCDAETNPPEVVDAGQVVIVVGIAPVKPAEFVIFRIGQSSTGASTNESGATSAKGGA